MRNMSRMVSRQAGAGARVNRYRERMRASGLRPVQIWLPDTKAPGFAAECRRQCLLLKGDPHEKEIMDWIEAVTDTTDWDS